MTDNKKMIGFLGKLINRLKKSEQDSMLRWNEKESSYFYSKITRADRFMLAEIKEALEQQALPGDDLVEEIETQDLLLLFNKAQDFQCGFDEFQAEVRKLLQEGK